MAQFADNDPAAFEAMSIYAKLHLHHSLKLFCIAFFVIYLSYLSIE